jgi:hypothetical protein
VKRDGKEMLIQFGHAMEESTVCSGYL